MRTMSPPKEAIEVSGVTVSNGVEVRKVGSAVPRVMTTPPLLVPVGKVASAVKAASRGESDSTGASRQRSSNG